jgi:hypothetical protein
MIEENLYLEINQHEVIEDESGNIPTLLPPTIIQNKEKLLNFCKYFIREALDGLGKCPPHFYDFVAVLYHYLGSVNEANVFQFIFINFFACALENPDEYQLTLKKPTKHARKTLAILAEMITNLAKGSEKIISDIPLDQSDRNEYVSKLQSWAQNDKQSFIPFDHNIDWTKERYHIMNLIDYIIENEYTIEHDLKLVDMIDSHPTMSFSYGINELLDTIDPPPFEVDKKEKKKTIDTIGLMQTNTLARTYDTAPIVNKSKSSKINMILYRKKRK